MGRERDGKTHNMDTYSRSANASGLENGDGTCKKDLIVWLCNHANDSVVSGIRGCVVWSSAVHLTMVKLIENAGGVEINTYSTMTGPTTVVAPRLGRPLRAAAIKLSDEMSSSVVCRTLAARLTRKPSEDRTTTAHSVTLFKSYHTIVFV